MYRCACLLLILISCSSPRPEEPERAARSDDSMTVARVADTTEPRRPVERDQVTIENREANGRRFRFSASRMPFDPKRHDISRLREGCLIDGEQMYGTDCDPPRFEFKDMQLEIGGEPVPIPRKVYAQFFDPHLGEEGRANGIGAFLSMDGNAAFVLMNGGDGAGAYHVVWCLRRDGNHSKMVTHDEVYFRFLDDRE